MKLIELCISIQRDEFEWGLHVTLPEPETTELILLNNETFHCFLSVWML